MGLYSLTERPLISGYATPLSLGYSRFVESFICKKFNTVVNSNSGDRVWYTMTRQD